MYPGCPWDRHLSLLERQLIVEMLDNSFLPDSHLATQFLPEAGQFLMDSAGYQVSRAMGY